MKICRRKLFFSAVAAAAAIETPTSAAALPIQSVSRRDLTNLQTVAVAQDKTVKFQIYAPAASEAHVDCNGRRGLNRDADGVWSVTIGPLEPDVYSYTLGIDSVVALPNAQNAFKKSPREDLFIIPADPPALWEPREVPRGAIHINWYASHSLGVTRRAHVYTPPGYETSGRARFPVLYLLHGSGDDDETWTTAGCAQNILDNLLSEGRVKPMVIVMPNGHVPPTPGPPARTAVPPNQKRFEVDLLQDLIPTIHRLYRVRTDPTSSAMAGLSMGAMQTQSIGFEHPGQFEWLGLMSGAGIGVEANNADTAFAETAAAASGGKQPFHLVYISVGKSDGLLARSRMVDDWLTRRGINHVFHELDGQHEWKVWRRSLIELVPMLFA